MSSEAAFPRSTVERVAMRVARGWSSRDLRALTAGVAYHYREARVALRAARGASSVDRALDFLLLAMHHRQRARRDRVRARACEAWLDPETPSHEFKRRIEAYVDMMTAIYNPNR